MWYGSPATRKASSSTRDWAFIRYSTATPSRASPSAPQLGHRPRDPERLLGFVARLEEARRLPLRVLRPEALLLPRLVVHDHRAGDLQDAARRAVVLLESDDAAAREVPLEVQDVPEVRAPEPVDRLIGVADDAEVPVDGRQLPQEPVLGGVGVLVLVDEHVSPQLAIVVEDLGMAREDLHRQPQEIVEVDRPELPEPGRIPGVEPRHVGLARPPRRRADVLRPEELVLRAGDAGDGRRPG